MKKELILIKKRKEVGGEEIMVKILYVDDNTDNRNKLEDILNKIGEFEVQGFEDGFDLIRYCKKLNESGIQVDIIFINCVMHTISGFDTLRAVMKINSNTKVIMMTGRHMQNVIDGIKLGAKWFVWKPLNKENVKSAVARFIELN